MRGSGPTKPGTSVTGQSGRLSRGQEHQVHRMRGSGPTEPGTLVTDSSERNRSMDGMDENEAIPATFSHTAGEAVQTMSTKRSHRSRAHKNRPKRPQLGR